VKCAHVRNLGCDIVHPLTPDVFVGLVENARISTERSTKVRDLASRDRDLVVRVFVARRQVAAGAVVALVDTFNAADDAEVEVVGVTDVSSVPCERGTRLDSLLEHLVGSLCVDVLPYGLAKEHVR